MTELDLTEAIAAGAKAIVACRWSPEDADDIPIGGYDVELAEAAVRAAVPFVALQAAQRGYEQAIATLREVWQRTGSPAAQWAADYLTVDPDRRSPRGATLCKSSQPGDPAVRCSSVADHPNLTIHGEVFNHGNPAAGIYWNHLDPTRHADPSEGNCPRCNEIEAVKYPHSACDIAARHIAHPWGDPQHWCNGAGKENS